jgi:peptidylprolyl isomerase
MAKAEVGNTVKVHYTGTLNDGTVFDSSLEREPLEFTLGSGQVIPGFDKGIVGMELNEKKQIVLPPEEAYGERNEELVLEVPKNDLPADLEPQIGQQLQMQYNNGQTIVVTITNMSDSSVSLDANFPLAGQTLTFDLELVEIV